MRTVRRVLLGAVFLVVGLPLAAHAQDPRLTRRLDAAALDGVTREIEAARDVGLPVEPLVQKALEGAARQADAPRIVAAVRGLRERMSSAREVLGAAATESELVAGAGALSVGVDPEGLRRIARESAASGGTGAALPLVVLADLVQQGVPPPSAVSAVASLARAGARPDGYNLLRYRVDVDIRSGASPTTAAERQSRLIVRSLGGGGRPPGMG